VYRRINDPLRIGCSNERPHPYQTLVAILDEAIRRLQVSSFERLPLHDPDGQAAPSSTTLAAAPANRFLWRGVRDVEEGATFRMRGGADMAPLSTSSRRKVAEWYAAGEATYQATLLFKIKVSNPFCCGADISCFSVNPGEVLRPRTTEGPVSLILIHHCRCWQYEYIFPPGTYLQPTGEAVSETMTFEQPGSTSGTTIRVLEVQAFRSNL
jgi:hypothetical protein